MQTYPCPMPTQLVVPGEIHLDRIIWRPTGAHVYGAVGDKSFAIALKSSDVLNRKMFITNVWRFKKLLGILPTIEAWQEQIAAAERRGKLAASQLSEGAA
jgi:hypothetical protein